MITGLLVSQNAQQSFCTNTLDRRIYRAELDEILHVTLKGYISSNYRGIFRYSVWGPRYGVPLGPQGGARFFEKIYQLVSFFFQQE